MSSSRPLESAGPAVFDPLSDVFVAQFARPEGLKGVNLRALTPFQRALLVIDGTVTKFIEASTLEPVTVVPISQEHRRLARVEDWLEAGAGTRVIARHVVLEGSHTHNFYALAASLLVVERLPVGIEEQLDRTPGGLGRVLADRRLESYRDILWYGRERVPVEELPDAVRSRTNGEFISRAYRIIIGGRPILLVNEKFPATPDSLPTHH